MIKEQRFFDALRDVFVGARIEGESGFVNLMRIKSRYYEQVVFPHLKKVIDEALSPFPEFREELFDRLYTFFRRYFSESGSIYFRFTPPHEHVYEQVYTDDRDVALFWKTHMLYYVKTDRLFRSMTVEVDGFRFSFDVSELEHRRANEKRALVYAFKGLDKDGTVTLKVAYQEKGKQTNIDCIRRSIKNTLGLKAYTPQVPSEEVLERAFRLFERQSEVDFFINRNARGFLREQFDLWLYQYVFEPEQRSATIWNERRIRQLQILKDIAYRIIDFIAQFEDELVRIWNKPKFVLKSHYVITLDRIAAQDGGLELLERLFADKGMAAQVQEWRELGMVEEDFTPEQVWVSDLTGSRLHERYQHLPLDTRHFPELETAVIALFDHLDQELDGWLVHSENYQALRTMLPKFRELIKCIYIDPPYNSKATEILYTNRYRHSSWLSLIENRLEVSRPYLRRDGTLVIAIDENEQERLGLLLEQMFPDFYRACVVIVHNSGGTQGRYFSYTHEYAYFCIAPGMTKTNEKPIPEEEWEWTNLRAWGNESERHTARNCFYPIYVKDRTIVGFGEVCPDDFHPGTPNVVRPDGIIEVYPVDARGVERKWRYARQSVESIRHLLRVHVTRAGEVQVQKAQATAPYKTVWSDPQYVAGDFGTRLLSEMGLSPDEDLYPKSIHTVADCLRSVVAKDSVVLDYFGGSGTTAHAVIDLNRGDGGRRKYIVVELADHFHSVLLPRVKKVVFSDRWDNGRAQPDGRGVSHFVKYFSLEQYEDVLRRAHYRDDDVPRFVQDDPYSQYVFLRDPKMLDNGETGERVVDMDAEKKEVRVDLTRLYPDLDLAETLSCLTGRWIRRIHPCPADPSRPGEVEFEDGTTVDLRNPPWEMVKPLIWW